MVSEKVWRGWALWDTVKNSWWIAMSGIFLSAIEDIHHAPYQEKVNVTLIPAADYDALQARVVELERELEGDQRHYGDVLERAHVRIATLEAELAGKTAECEECERLRETR